MQSIRLSKEIIYTIPDKLRWDAWWLIPRAVTRHASPIEGWDWHPRLSTGNAAVRHESTARKS